MASCDVPRVTEFNNKVTSHEKTEGQEVRQTLNDNAPATLPGRYEDESMLLQPDGLVSLHNFNNHAPCMAKTRAPLVCRDESQKALSPASTYEDAHERDGWETIRQLVTRASHRFRKLGHRLYGYQKNVVAWMMQRERKRTASELKGGLLAMEMGLGKTVVTLFTILASKGSKPTLVIVPNPLVRQWKRECDTFLGKYVTSEIATVRGGRVCGYTGEADVVISTYSTFIALGKRDRENNFVHRNILLEQQWGRVVLDEAHKAKNDNASVTRQMRRLKTDIMWLLTGTPVHNKPNDYVILLDHLKVPDIKKKFYRRYTNQGLSTQQLQQLQELTQAHMYRLTKEDIGIEERNLEIPPYDSFVHVEPFATSYEQNIYDQAENRVVNLHQLGQREAAEFRQQMQTEILEALTRQRQACVDYQLVIDGYEKKHNNTITELILDTYTSKKNKWRFERPEGPQPYVPTKMLMLQRQLVITFQDDPTAKALVFTHWTEEGHQVGNILDDLKLPNSFVNGAVGGDMRADAIEEFVQAPGPYVLVMQMEVGAYGLNLQCATKVFLLSVDWNPNQELQAIGRAHRQGQKKTVQVHHFAIQDTIEDRIVKDMHRLKLECAATILQDERIALRYATRHTVSPERRAFEDPATPTNTSDSANCSASSESDTSSLIAARQQQQCCFAECKL